MASGSHSGHDKNELPRQEIVDVFRELGLDGGNEFESLERLAESESSAKKQPTYYSIEVTGTIEQPDCNLVV
jgi:hypothetical protein